MPFHSAEQHHVHAEDGEKDPPAAYHCPLRTLLIAEAAPSSRIKDMSAIHTATPSQRMISLATGQFHAVAHLRVGRPRVCTRERLYSSGVQQPP